MMNKGSRIKYCEFCFSKGKRVKATHDVLLQLVYGGSMAYVCDTHVSLRNQAVKAVKI